MSRDVSWSVPGPVTGSHSHTGTWSHFKMNTLVINHLKHNSANSMKIADCPPSMGQLLHSGSLVVVTSEYVKFQSGSFNPTLHNASYERTSQLGTRFSSTTHNSYTICDLSEVKI